MAYLSLTPMLRTADLEAAISFYVGLLGFRCDNRDPEQGWAWLSRDGVALMLALPNAHMPFEQPTFTGSLYFRLSGTGEVYTLYHDIKDVARVCYPINDFGYGMLEFAIYDNDGYTLQFGAPTTVEETPSS